VLAVSILPLSTIIPLDFGTVPIVWHSLFDSVGTVPIVWHSLFDLVGTVPIVWHSLFDSFGTVPIVRHSLFDSIYERNTCMYIEVRIYTINE
jgi:hypothetical protein